MVVPSATVTGRPSMVRFTIFCSAMLRHRRRYRVETAALNEGLEFAAELLDAGDDRDRTRIAQHADGLPRHLLGDVEQGVEVFYGSFAVPDTLEDLGRPGCS